MEIKFQILMIRSCRRKERSEKKCKLENVEMCACLNNLIISTFQQHTSRLWVECWIAEGLLNVADYGIATS